LSRSVNPPPRRLSRILHLGKESLYNRWKLHLSLCLLLIFLPRSAAFLFNIGRSTTFVDQVRQQFTAGQDLLGVWERLASETLNSGVLISFLGLLLSAVGVLAIGSSSANYFDHKTTSMGQSISSGAKLLVLKGAGVMFALSLAMLPAAVFTLFRVILLCLLLVLPIELAAGHRGGIGSTINVLLLKYCPPQQRWPLFSSLMTMGGVIISLVFVFKLLLSYFVDLDLDIPGTFHWVGAPVTIAGGQVSTGYLAAHIVELLFDALFVATVLPFMAALRFSTQDDLTEQSGK